MTSSPISTSTSTFAPPSFNSSLGGAIHVHESRLFGKSQCVINSVTHKTRTFGQSHWINGAILIRDTVELIEPYVHEESSVILSNMKRCKHLARVIKSGRVPSWPSPPSADLPSREVADELVDCYLQTIESVYRVLHIPTFKKDYEAIWSPNSKPHPAFLILLKLVLAIGATMYDKNFSLRSSAIRWTYEAQTSISEPRFKSMLGIQCLQIQILLLIARETADVSGEMVWISVGALYRTAIQMGLHRDPAQLPKSTTFMAEMRRRLWNTILEISVQSSLTSGGPPLTSLDDFSTEPPGNFDDEQIVTEDSQPKPEDQFTQTSVAIALRTTLPFRLAVTKLLNDASSHNTYEATLKLDADLKASYKALCRVLQKFKPSATCTTTRYAMRLVDIIMHRYLSALHIPFFGPAFQETEYAFSRKVVTESSLKIWYLAFPTTFNNTTPSISDKSASERDNLARLMICGSGFFRTIIFQATFTMAIELKCQLQEDQGLGPVTARPDLLSLLDGAKEWCFRCIEAGETSIKGYLFLCLISAQIDGLMHGLDKDKLPESLIKAAEEAEARCLPILEAAASEFRTGGASNESDPTSLYIPPETSENWDFLVGPQSMTRLHTLTVYSKFQILCSKLVIRIQ